MHPIARFDLTTQDLFRLADLDIHPDSCNQGEWQDDQEARKVTQCRCPDPEHPGRGQVGCNEWHRNQSNRCLKRFAVNVEEHGFRGWGSRGLKNCKFSLS